MITYLRDFYETDKESNQLFCKQYFLGWKFIKFFLRHI
jgi:hypothetical protein